MLAWCPTDRNVEYETRMYSGTSNSVLTHDTGLAGVMRSQLFNKFVPPPRSSPQRGCRRRSADCIGPSPHPRGVSHGLRRCPAAPTLLGPRVTNAGPTPSRGPTRTPRSHFPTTCDFATPPHHPATKPVRAGCLAVFADAFLLQFHGVPSTPFVVPVASCFCRPSGAPHPPSSSLRYPPLPRRPEDGAAARLRGVGVHVVLRDG